VTYWELTVEIDVSTTPASYKIVGQRDGFPAHDVFINDAMVDNHDPRVTGEGLLSLPAPMEHDINQTGTLP